MRVMFRSLKAPVVALVLSMVAASPVLADSSDADRDQARRVRDALAAGPSLLSGTSPIPAARRVVTPRDRSWSADGATERAVQGGDPPRGRSVGRAVAGGIVGAVGGFFAGAYLGAAIEGDDCNCDDPGLQGALIGAPIGIGVGAILGTLYLF